LKHNCWTQISAEVNYRLGYAMRIAQIFDFIFLRKSEIPKISRLEKIRNPFV